MASKMVSPVQGYISSSYGTRSGTFHAGVDIAGGGVSRPVYAAFAGTLSHIVRGRKHGQSARVGKVVAYLRSGNGGRVKNPDGEQQVYIHVNFLSKWKNGMKVKAGDLLGYTDLSGMSTGYHLHFEIWNRNGKTRNPVIDFRYFGIKVGSKPKLPSPPSKPKPKPSPKPASDAKKSLTASVRTALKAMGLPATVAGVQRYQKEHGLYPDGVWGPVTRRYYHWVKLLQTYLNKWAVVKRTYGSLRVDGFRGPITKNAERLARSHDTRSEPYSPPKEPAKRG